jgi:hypothetical protein
VTNADAAIADVKRRFDVAPQYFGTAAPVTALLYPLALVALYSGGQMLRAASSWESELSAWILTLAAVILVYGVPATSFWIIFALGQLAAPSRAQVRVRAWTHLAFASPPLFTALGVLFYLLRSSSGDYIAWTAMWLAISLAMLSTGHDQQASVTEPEAGASAPLLISTHGLSALTIMLVFLAPHIANHLTAIWSADLHKSVMDGLRTVYRTNVIQPALVALLLFQIASGGALLRRRVGVQNDIFGSLQTAAGAYLGVFVVSHLTAVFILGRHVMQVDTNWDFAIGAPAGMMDDPWNVRLVPHYSLAVFLLFSHVACGMRMVLLGRSVSAPAATRTAVAIIALGGAVALTVTLAMLRVHVGPIASMHTHRSFTPLLPAQVV